MFKKDNTDIFIDYGSEKLKNIFHLNSIEWWTEIYADWLPYFCGEWLRIIYFRKSKKVCWKIFKNIIRFERAFI